MSNPPEFDYIEAKEFLHLPVIEVTDVKSFIRFARANDLKFVFKMPGQEGRADFFFPLGGIVYKINGGGFKTLEEMQESESRGFPSSVEYYASQKAGFGSYREYVDLANTGIENKQEYEAAYKAGFVAGFDKFKLRYEHYSKYVFKSIIPDDLDNPVKVHKYALSKGFDTYDQFEKIYNIGFPDLLTYNDAVAKGFSLGMQYYEAIKKGFGERKEYDEANKLSIGTKKEFDEYRFLRDMNEKRNYAYDELQLLITLSNCENGQVIAIPEMRKMLNEAQDKYKRDAGTEGHRILPMWYSRKLDKEENLLKFLKENEELKKFGFFNSAKNAFEIFKASAVKIFVDGSNVAYNSNNRDKTKPEIKNIRLLVKELNFRKFKNITVIADAKLRHDVIDPHLIDELKKECEYYQVPANTSADVFLIQSIKSDKCLVVTNDQFKDWKKDDQWLRDKFDSIRVPFVINKEQKVMLTGFNEMREKLVGE